MYPASLAESDCFKNSAVMKDFRVCEAWSIFNVRGGSLGLLRHHNLAHLVTGRNPSQELLRPYLALSEPRHPAFYSSCNLDAQQPNKPIGNAINLQMMFILLHSTMAEEREMVRVAKAVLSRTSSSKFGEETGNRGTAGFRSLSMSIRLD